MYQLIKIMKYIYLWIPLILILAEIHKFSYFFRNIGSDLTTNFKKMRSWVSRNDVSCDIIIHNFTKNYPSPWSIEFCCSKWAMTRLSATNSSHHSGLNPSKKLHVIKFCLKNKTYSACTKCIYFSFEAKSIIYFWNKLDKYFIHHYSHFSNYTISI